MKERHPLVLDLNNVFSPAVKGGLSSLSKKASAFKDAHKAVTALKGTGQLPYCKVPEDSVLLSQVVGYAEKYKDVDNVIVFGCGGSALGLSSIYSALKGPFHLIKDNKPQLHVIDNVDPKTLTDIVNATKNSNNLYVLVSKSGNTSEILALKLFLTKEIKDFNNKLFIITDAHEGYLRDYAKKNEIPTLPVPLGVGGRFSVFTPVGLFPLAVCGVNVVQILDGATHAETLAQNPVLEQNPAGLLAMSLHALTAKKKVSQVVMMPYADRLRLFTDWFAQLWSESLGKKNHTDGKEAASGTTPIKSVGVTDQHSQLQLYLEGPKDKVVIFVEVENWSTQGMVSEEKINDERIDYLSGKSLAELLRVEKEATEETLRENDIPNLSIKMPFINEFQLGQLYQMWMNVIPYMGVLLDINAFDQPAVERIKKFTYGLMGRNGFEDIASSVFKKKKELIF